MGVENFCIKLPKGTPLRQIWSNKSFGLCGSDVVLYYTAARKKVSENRHWKLDVVYNTTSLPRRRYDQIAGTTETANGYVKRMKLKLRQVGNV